MSAICNNLVNVVQPEPKTSLSGWVVANMVAALTLVAVVLYGLVSLGHQTFYSQFGLAPQDVGLGYGEALARASGFALYVLLVVALAFVSAWIGGVSRAPRTRRWTRLNIALVVFGVVLLAITVVVISRDAANAAKRGESVRPMLAVGTGIRAEPVELAWIERPPDTLRSISRHQLVFLGRSDGTTYLYDVDDERTIQIPDGIAALSLSP
jgi:hypothetical protein